MPIDGYVRLVLKQPPSRTEATAAVGRAVDLLLEVPVAPSFTRVGYEVRRRLVDWPSPGPGDLAGRVMVITGGTSGLGRSAASTLAAAGASVVIVGRNGDRNDAAVDAIRSQTGSDLVEQLPADLAEPDQVRDLAATILNRHDRLDVLVHNAGALLDTFTVNSEGMETTVASQVVGPFLLTTLLLDRLSQSGPSRVLTMSSGGMYTSRLRVDDLEMTADDYNGLEQYARAKRAQVTLNELWAERHTDRGVRFHALHPGWADTPGVDDALPLFSRALGPLLRTPDQGADTLVWLASSAEALETNGCFWHDRRIRPLHRLPTTSRSDTPEARQQLWDWVEARAGV